MQKTQLKHKIAILANVRLAMKIGISTTSVYNIQKKPKKIDGIGTYTLNLCQALAAQNVLIEEIYFKTLTEIVKPKAGSQFLIANNPLLSLIPGNIYHLAKEIALLHVTDYLVPRVSKIPVVASIHDAIMLKDKSWQNNSKPIKKLKSFLLKKMAGNAHHYITCSHAMVEDLVKYWKISPDKISVTHYGLDSSWRKPLPEALITDVLNKYQINSPFFLTVGTLQPRKNFEKIIDAYYNLPKEIFQNFKLVIVGKYHPSLTPPMLIERIQTLNETGQVLWLKYVTLEELRCLYQSALLLLFPSLEEGFGFPILEGFASKTPVITSNFGSMAEIAEQAALLVDPHSTDEIQSAIVKIIENQNLRNSLISLGFSRVQNFTWDKCAKETFDVYKKFI